MSESRSIAPARDSRAPSLASQDSKPAITWTEREAIAREIGQFLARCLAGQHRGSSGRDRNPLASRFWLVARDFEGQILTPVRVFRSWGGCKALVKSKQDCGDSVFVGLPTETELKIACAAAELQYPTIIEQ